MTKKIDRIDLPSPSPGTERHLTVIRYRSANPRPMVYLQTGLHADELPGMLVLDHLIRKLDEADAKGMLEGQIVIVPAANPIGLSQRVERYHIGRFDLDGGGNFNRLYPDLAGPVGDLVDGKLTDSAEGNVARIRAAMTRYLSTLDEVRTETEALRLVLMRLACEADIALDLHCDSEAIMHLYFLEKHWPDAEDLHRLLGSDCTLLANQSGGEPFDEALSTPWLALQERFPDHPIPAACLASTLELRGQADVSDELAGQDADALFRFLQHRGVISGDPGLLPEARSEATPLAGVDMIEAPVAGIVSFKADPGQHVTAGDLVAEILDPMTGVRTAVHTRQSGVVFGRRSNRLVRQRDIFIKVAGKEALEGREGNLLTS
jgi:predicted deacylase